jgi:hypothetical protein
VTDRLYSLTAYGSLVAPPWWGYIVATSSLAAKDAALPFVPEDFHLETPRELPVPVGALLASRPLLGTSLTIGEWQEGLRSEPEPTEAAGQARLFGDL